MRHNTSSQRSSPDSELTLVEPSQAGFFSKCFGLDQPKNKFFTFPLITLFKTKIRVSWFSVIGLIIAFGSAYTQLEGFSYLLLNKNVEWVKKEIINDDPEKTKTYNWEPKVTPESPNPPLWSNSCQFGFCLYLGIMMFFIPILSTLIHELGHGLTACWFGGKIDWILLWPLGGVCYTVMPFEVEETKRKIEVELSYMEDGKIMGLRKKQEGVKDKIKKLKSGQWEGRVDKLGSSSSSSSTVSPGNTGPNIRKVEAFPNPDRKRSENNPALIAAERRAFENANRGTAKANNVDDSSNTHNNQESGGSSGSSSSNAKPAADITAELTRLNKLDMSLSEQIAKLKPDTVHNLPQSQIKRKKQLSNINLKHSLWVTIWGPLTHILITIPILFSLLTLAVYTMRNEEGFTNKVDWDKVYHYDPQKGSEFYHYSKPNEVIFTHYPWPPKDVKPELLNDPEFLARVEDQRENLHPEDRDKDVHQYILAERSNPSVFNCLLPSVILRMSPIRNSYYRQDPFLGCEPQVLLRQGKRKSWMHPINVQTGDEDQSGYRYAWLTVYILRSMIEINWLFFFFNLLIPLIPIDSSTLVTHFLMLKKKNCTREFAAKFLLILGPLVVFIYFLYQYVVLGWIVNYILNDTSAIKRHVPRLPQIQTDGQPTNKNKHHVQYLVGSSDYLNNNSSSATRYLQIGWESFWLLALLLESIFAYIKLFMHYKRKNLRNHELFWNTYVEKTDEENSPDYIPDYIEPEPTGGMFTIVQSSGDGGPGGPSGNNGGGNLNQGNIVIRNNTRNNSNSGNNSNIGTIHGNRLGVGNSNRFNSFQAFSGQGNRLYDGDDNNNYGSTN